MSDLLVYRNKGERRLYITRPIKVAFLILLFYLLQSCVMPYFRIGGVIGNLNLVLIAILTVSLGKKYAFVSAAIVGIIMESVERNMPSFYIIIYPTLALIFAQLFSDMSEIKREIRRIRIKSDEQNKKIDTIKRRNKWFKFFRASPADDINPHIRILLNAVSLQAAYEFIMIIIVALNGVSITWNHLLNAIKAMSYTAFLSLLMFPVRYFLGMYRKKTVKDVGDDYEQYELSPQNLQEIAIIPEMPEADSLAGFEMRMSAGVEKIDISSDNNKEDGKEPDNSKAEPDDNPQTNDDKKQESTDTDEISAYNDNTDETSSHADDTKVIEDAD